MDGPRSQTIDRHLTALAAQFLPSANPLVLEFCKSILQSRLAPRTESGNLSDVCDEIEHKLPVDKRLRFQASRRKLLRAAALSPAE